MPAALAGRPPFVGRETQLGVLKSAVAAAELGEPVLVLVAGEPGIGKTRLIQELASQVLVHVVWAALVLGNATVWAAWAILAGEYAAGVPSLVNGPAALLIIVRLRQARRPSQPSHFLIPLAADSDRGRPSPGL